jgi:DNA-binding response OmpR family regulator
MTKHDVREYILIIEDEPAVARALLRTLHRDGYHATAALNADEAFNAIEARTPDLILLDGSLPIVGGVEICRIVRGRHATLRTPILFVTADDSASHRLAASEAGADAFMAKPYRTEELRERVRFLLALARRADEPPTSP